MSAKLSVAMCTYNGGRFVAEQLASIAEQTRLPDELVVCDDGSTDSTVEVIEKFAVSAPFPVRAHVNEKNLGSTKNYEQAIRFCTGDLIALADQDDVWLPEKLARIEQEFARSPRVGLVFSDAEAVDEGLQPLGYTIWQSLKFDAQSRKRFREGGAFEMELRQNFVTGATMAFRSRYRDLTLPLHEAKIARFGMPSWDLIHDGWITLLVAAVADVDLIEEPLVKYRQHSRQQLGMAPPANQAPKPVADLRTRAATRYDDSFAGELKLLRTVRERLASKASTFGGASVVAALDSRIVHISARAAMPASRLRRLPGVLRELFTLRYSRYSNGALSAAKDLLL